MNKTMTLISGVIAYIVFFITFLYSIGFVGNLMVPKSIDSDASSSFTMALIINLLLLALFAVQHSVMARPFFKKWWVTIIPEAIERSTYVMMTNIVLILLFWLWQPINTIVWSVDNNAATAFIWGMFWFGWVMVLISTFLLNHFELFGLSQVYMNMKGQEADAPTFKTPLLYKLVRHPIMLGFIIAFWATPIMTVGHLIFAIMTTAYVLIAIQFEELDLVNLFGQTYQDYQKQVSMILPWPKGK